MASVTSWPSTEDGQDLALVGLYTAAEGNLVGFIVLLDTVSLPVVLP